MADQSEKDKVPFKSPSWLVEASKKRPAAPSKAFLDKLQYVREHPYEYVSKLRDQATHSGRVPGTVATVMAGMIESNQIAQSAQRSKDIERATLSEESSRATLESVSSPGDETYDARVDLFSPSSPRKLINLSTQNRSSGSSPSSDTQDAASSAGTFKTVQRRFGAKGQITKPGATYKQSQQDDGNRHVPKQTYGNEPAGASGKDSPMEVDSPQRLTNSSPLSAVFDSANAITSAPENSIESPMDPVASYSFPARSTFPAWYLSLTQKEMARLDRKRPQEIAAIDALKDCVRRCVEERRESSLARIHNELRDHIHKAEVKLVMDRVKVKKTRILVVTGLPQIFNEHANFPWDIKADAWHLYERWMNDDFDHDILRGIYTSKEKSRSGDRLDPAYAAKHPKEPKIFGDNGAVVGQWWPTQLCALRDGVHGSAQGGIHGDKDRGAYSIVLSSGGYHDRDDGDTIEYSGTEGSNFEIKAATQSMITSARLGNVIRVLRSSQLPKSNKYRPSCGLRYDGLYQIKTYKEVDPEKQTYQFCLERVPGQSPIRYEGPTKRPTIFEEEAYNKCKGRIN